mmetsp:Transcript_99795/g.258024  ORF Transcript_99795/g.258024 Transcript_99795/m.258024 type:complete len:224 (-) Transcript_99795:900-1571(-)
MRHEVVSGWVALISCCADCNSSTTAPKLGSESGEAVTAAMLPRPRMRDHGVAQTPERLRMPRGRPSSQGREAGLPPSCAPPARRPLPDAGLRLWGDLGDRRRILLDDVVKLLLETSVVAPHEPTQRERAVDIIITVCLSTACGRRTWALPFTPLLMTASVSQLRATKLALGDEFICRPTRKSSSRGIAQAESRDGTDGRGDDTKPRAGAGTVSQRSGHAYVIP